MMTGRLFDMPYQSHYGAVRRFQRVLHPVCPDPGRLDSAFYAEWGENWDEHLARLIDEGSSEDEAMRLTASRCVDAYSESFVR